MKKFVEDLITYIDGKFTADTSITKTINGKLAYSTDTINFQDTILKYVVEILDYRTTGETFNNESEVSEPLQITINGIKTSINGSLKEANEVAFILAEKMISFLESYKYSNSNKNIVEMRRMTTSAPMPYNDAGTVYTVSIRYDFTLRTPYVS